MLKKAIFTLTLFGSLILATASADTLVVDGVDASNSKDAPQRGQTQVAVESKLGAPTSKSAPVGEPPISKWNYESFTVYFEHDKVIHTVAKR